MGLGFHIWRNSPFYAQRAMNAKTLGTVCGHVAGWCAIVSFVLLLTFIFSFLGTIFCAVLAGMMLGSMRPRRWHSVPISLLFPATIFLMLRAMKAELLERQIDLLSLLCLGAFWLTFLLAGVVVSAEQKARTAPGPGRGSRGRRPRRAGRSGLSSAPPRRAVRRPGLRQFPRRAPMGLLWRDCREHGAGKPPRGTAKLMRRCSRLGAMTSF